MNGAEPHWEVESIIGRRRNSKTGDTEYLIKWKGFEEYESTWENESNCIEKGSKYIFWKSGIRTKLSPSGILTIIEK
jgi:uncharacterized protein YcnI